MHAVLSAIRHKPDRWLHAARHRRAKALVTAKLRAPSCRVLVLCHGNICRSPYAAAVVRRAVAPLGIPVASAGLVGAGRPIPAHAHTCALRRGEDLSSHRSQLIGPQLMRSATLVIVMDVAQRDLVLARYPRDAASVVLLGDLDPAPILKRAVRDPYAQSVEVFEEVFARIDRCGETIARCAGTAGTVAHAPRGGRTLTLGAPLSD